MAITEVDQTLDQIDSDYGGDMADHLGSNWREILRPHLESCWYFGYTTGRADLMKELFK